MKEFKKFHIQAGDVMDTGSKVITEIRSHGNSSLSKHIRNEIVDDQVFRLFGNLFEDKEREILQNCYVDVPVANIFGLQRLGDTWEHGDSWLDVVNNRLIGEDWNEDVFEYFEGELFDKEFPPISSKGSLELYAYGEAVLCQNGNHRLPAGVCWLASNFGDSYSFKKVALTLFPLDSKKIEQLKAFYRNCSDGVKIYKQPLNDYLAGLFNGEEGDYIIKIEDRLYCMGKNGITLGFEPEDRYLEKLKRLLAPELRELYTKKRNILGDDLESWQKVPDHFLQKVFSTEWFENAYTSEEKLRE